MSVRCSAEHQSEMIALRQFQTELGKRLKRVMSRSVISKLHFAFPTEPPSKVWPIRWEQIQVQGFQSWKCFSIDLSVTHAKTYCFAWLKSSMLLWKRLFEPHMDRRQSSPLRARADLGIMITNRDYNFPKLLNCNLIVITSCSFGSCPGLDSLYDLINNVLQFEVTKVK